MAEFTDKEIREAYADAKKDRAIALGCELPDQARLEHVKMAALFRWMSARRERAQKTSRRKTGNTNTP